MTDRELLDLAASAAGLTVNYRVSKNAPYDAAPVVNDKPWNPLADDGDALRLAVKLKLDVFTGQGMRGDMTTVSAPPEHDIESCGERHGDDAFAATRRAIVRAAAEIGKGI